MSLTAPFPCFGGKRAVIDTVWPRLGRPRQYIEPFCGSAAMLLGAPAPAALEVVNDLNGFIANFWRCVRHQPAAVAEWTDYPVSHIDLGARHRWLMEQRSLDGWDVVRWTRPRLTYNGAQTTDREALWFSPACLPAVGVQGALFGGAA